VILPSLLITEISPPLPELNRDSEDESIDELFRAILPELLAIVTTPPFCRKADLDLNVELLSVILPELLVTVIIPDPPDPFTTVEEEDKFELSSNVILPELEVSEILPALPPLSIFSENENDIKSDSNLVLTSLISPVPDTKEIAPPLPTFAKESELKYLEYEDNKELASEILPNAEEKEISPPCPELFDGDKEYEFNIELTIAIFPKIDATEIFPPLPELPSIVSE
jgi:hypothetical protein